MGLVCWNDNIKWTFLGMLLALQCVCYSCWFGMIIRVAYKVLSGQGADDTRSDDEDEEDERSAGRGRRLGRSYLSKRYKTGIEPKPFIEKGCALSTDQDV